MPREQRQAVLAAAAVLAEQDYHFDKELTSFETFTESAKESPCRERGKPPNS